MLFSQKSLLYYYVVMGELCVWLAGLHVKYRSLVPEFLWLGFGSVRHFVLLTLCAVVFLTSSSISSSTSLTLHQSVHTNPNTHKHKHTHTHTHTHIRLEWSAKAKLVCMGCVVLSKLLNKEVSF